MSADQRPELTSALDPEEFRRWYWLKEELLVFARAQRFPASGPKLELADRVEAFLGGRELPQPAPRPKRRTARLEEPLTRSTVIPDGQTAGPQIRGFFEAELGPTFRFDWFMRTFIAESPGRTLGDAIDHWRATRDLDPPDTPEQFELIRFTKAWHLANPDGSAAQCRAAWRTHRSLPIDERPGPTAPSPEQFA